MSNFLGLLYFVSLFIQTTTSPPPIQIPQAFHHEKEIKNQPAEERHQRELLEARMIALEGQVRREKIKAAMENLKPWEAYRICSEPWDMSRFEETLLRIRGCQDVGIQPINGPGVSSPDSPEARVSVRTR
jgi:hypothetical protein